MKPPFILVARKKLVCFDDFLQCHQVLIVPSSFITFMLGSSRSTDSLETVVEQFNQGAVVSRCQLEGNKCTSWPSHVRVVPVVIDRKLATRSPDYNLAAVGVFWSLAAPPH